MVDLTRRSFLGGLLAVAAVAIVKVPEFHNYPVLYMDGKSDDSPALQAMLDGKHYIIEGELIKGTTHISGGEYFMHSCVHVTGDNAIIEDARFVASKKLRGYMFDIQGNYIIMRNCALHANLNSGYLTSKLSTTKSTRIDVSGRNVIAATPFDTNYKFTL